MAGLEVQIGADNSDLNKKIKEAELNLKELSNIKLEQIKPGLDTKEINANIASVKKSLTELKTVSKDSGNAIAGMAPKVANGGNALMQFSRIAQDAPFGIIGIGNNITATVEAFGHLQQSTGGTGGALKAMAGSLLGSGGILLAVSLVTTGLTYMSQNGITVGDVFRRLTGDFDEYASALKKVNDAAYEDAGVKDAIENVNELTINIDLAKRGFLSKEKVVEQYNETIGKTTGFVTSLDEAEKELTKNGDAYIKMTLYKAAANLALEAAAKATLQAEKSRQKSLKEFTNSFLDADLTQTRSKEQYEAKQQNLKRQQEKRQQDEVKINSDAAQRNINIAKKFQEDAAKIATQFNFNLFGDNKQGKAKKPEKVFSTPQVSGIKGEILPAPTVDLNGLKVFTGALDKFKQPIKELPGVFKTAMIESKTAFDMGIADIGESMIEFSNSANSIIQGAITDTFSSLGAMIGNSMAGADGGLEDAGKNILGIIGKFMTQFGELMISTGVGLVIAKKMLTSGNGYAMIAGGVALVAIGTAFAASSKKSQQSAGNSLGGGGSVSTGGSYSSPASNSYSGGGGGGNFGSGTVVFEISGQKLIGVLNNTLDNNRRLGGSLGL